MTKLKLGPLVDNRPVKLTVEVPAPVHRDLLAYAAVLAAETGASPVPPEKLIAPMLARFMATDRGLRGIAVLRATESAACSVAGEPLESFTAFRFDDGGFGVGTFIAPH